MFSLADRLGRTVEELVFGGPGHRPLSADEMTAWAGYFQILNWEAEKARNKKRR